MWVVACGSPGLGRESVRRGWRFESIITSQSRKALEQAGIPYSGGKP